MPEIGKNHHAQRAWDTVVDQIEAAITRQQADPSQTVVLLPYAQLMQVARDAWLRRVATTAQGAAFLPRFETSSNWSRRLGAFCPGPDDMRLDAARDVLTAQSLMQRAGMGRQHRALVVRLMEAAWVLAKVAAAVPPAGRAAWAEQMSAAVCGPGADGVTQIESWLGRIALAWAANSAYATDRLFDAQPGLLVLVQGFLQEPLHNMLQTRFADRCVAVPLYRPVASGGLSLHAARDAEDEAERASACVLQHLAAGRSPVALVAQDRFLVRRMRALLGNRGVVLRDETGWTLSTTSAAASVVGALRAMAWDASGDTVLDWLKAAPAFAVADVSALEAQMRANAMRSWRQIPAQHELATQVRPLIESMQARRPLAAWLASLRGVLLQAGQWPALLQDDAGQAVLQAMRLHEGAEREFDDLVQVESLAGFVRWAEQVLEQGSFVPAHPPQEQVIVLPLSQLLGRSPAAVVFPGCDEERFAASPEPGGLWSAAQRLSLGLPTREMVAGATRAAWQHALGGSHIDVLWRCSHNGDARMPGLLVQEVLLDRPELAPDPRVQRLVAVHPCFLPRPVAPELVPAVLSASAYTDLRTCPYKFFALRELRLRESDELEVELDKRDFGLWLHAALRHFHEALLGSPTTHSGQRLVLMADAAARATKELGLTDAEFLRYSAAWPRTRASYLAWLSAHEASGARFVAAESDRRLPLGTLTLVGRLDRIDQLADGAPLVIDYKTESRETTAARVRADNDDIQLAFYAALLANDTLDAQYLSLAETMPAQNFRHLDVVALRDVLVEAIRGDIHRLAAGASLPALGSGLACSYCAARGLCRKDQWTPDAAAAQQRNV